MNQSEKSIMKIYTSSTDKIEGKLVYEFIVHKAKKQGIAGATVYRGIMGYGPSSSHISSSTYWELTEKLPVMIEIIDKTEILESFCHILEPELANIKKGILITLEPVHVFFQKSGVKKAQ